MDFGSVDNRYLSGNRLQRSLDSSGSKFRVVIGNPDMPGANRYYDGAITSISISRGSSSADTTPVVPTAEIGLSEDIELSYGAPVQVIAQGPDWLMSQGNLSTLIARRFTGWIGLQDREVRTIIGGQARAQSTVYGVGGIKALLGNKRTVPVTYGENLRAVWDSLEPAAWRTGKHEWLSPDIDGAQIWPDEKNLAPAAKDLVTNLADAQLMVYETRWGDLQLKSIPRRIKEADGQAGLTVPVIETHHVEQPLTLRQLTPLDPDAKVFRTLIYDGKSWPTLNLTPDWDRLAAYGITRPTFTEVEDWTYFGWRDSGDTSHPRLAFNALIARQAGLNWQVPDITFDLLRLANTYGVDTETINHRRDLVTTLLGLEEGSPVALGSSFGAYAGVHFATGIKETVTPSKWEIALSLVPRDHVTGELTTPRTWNDAPWAWTTENLTTWSS